MRFDGRVVAVVGAGFGWGRAAAVRLAMEGAYVFVIDADEAAISEVCCDIRGRGGRAETIGADPAEYGALARAAEACRSVAGAVDVLITHHFTVEWGTVEECDPEAFARVVHYNLVGPVFATKAFLPLLKEAERAAIVHIGSVDGLFGNPRAVSYSASKGGLVPLTHIMAREFAIYGIRVNTVATCQTNQITDESLADARNPPLVLAATAASAEDSTRFPGNWFLKQLSDATPLKRSGPLEEWAGTVAFLASDEAAYVSGSVVVVDCARTGLTPGTFPWNSPTTT